MNTRKKILSLLLAAVMALSLLPTAAFAEGDAAVQASTHTKRTTVLDLSNQTTDTANADEGWRWDASKKTLTLNGATIDVIGASMADSGIKLPVGARIVTKAGTVNAVTCTGSSTSTAGAVIGMGSLTIEGSGSLSVKGDSGIYAASGNLVIKAPLTAVAVGSTSNDAAIWVDGKGTITIDSSLEVQEPVNGKAKQDGEMTFIANADGNRAKKVEIVSNAPAAPTFTDGFGNTVDATSKYVKGTTKNTKGYTFAGWFDEQGNELEDVTKAAAGVTYTARWSNNGKTVRTTELDLTSMPTTDKTTDEGWSWNAKSKTLTLNGATFDVHQDNALAAIILPDGATITTVKNTKNTVINHSVIFGAPEEWGPVVGGGISGAGKLTINGDGELSVTGGSVGISAVGDLTINAPISVNCTKEDDGHIYYAICVDEGAHITIGASLRITTPANGKIGSDKELPKSEYVAESDGKTPAVNVVIEKVASHYYYYSGSTSSNTPNKSPKTADAGIALYAGMAVASLLGSGVVFSRKRRSF